MPAYGGATVELDKTVYTWTDVVYITVTAPDFNSDPNLINTIQVSVATTGHVLSPYKLVETGTDTGIFTGKVTLDGTGNVSGITNGIGPTDGLIDTSANDTIQVLFKFTKDQTVTGSAIIRSSPPPPPLGTDVVISLGSSTTGCEQTKSCFQPDEAKVDVGGEVTWYNGDTASHTVTSGDPSGGPDGKFDSSMIATGKSFSHRFDQAGTFTYFCQLHPWMTGVVAVRGGSGPPSTINDTIAPLIIVPSGISVQATSASGAVVQYAVKAIDNVDGIISPSCNPPSNSLFPIGSTVVSCSARDSSGNSAVRSFAVNVKAPSILIPSWVKDVAKFWCSDEIDDTGFAQAIQYLITNKVIIISETPTVSITNSQQIPLWIKHIACWWSSGQISDQDFTSGIQYLVQQGIIRV